jgi:hypothetical protein
VTPEQTNSALAILTLLLAWATVWLAVATWRMASITKASFDLESRPYFAFKDFLFKFFLEKPADDSLPPTRGAVRIGLKFRNPGRVLIHYQVKNIRITFSGSTVDNPKYELMGGPIYPNDETIFWYSTIQSIDLSTMPKTGIVEYEVDYYAIEKKQTFKSSRKIQYTINSINPFNMDWLYLEEKDA